MLGFILGVEHSMGPDKCIMAHIPYYSILHNLGIVLFWTLTYFSHEIAKLQANFPSQGIPWTMSNLREKKNVQTSLQMEENSILEELGPLFQFCLVLTALQP